MLSYRHAFHAGGHTDVLKHLVLVNTIAYATRKSAPLFYLDTHAGAGVYRLHSREAQLTREAEAGILSLDFQTILAGTPEPGRAAVQAYYDAISSFVTRGLYPGSPLLAAGLLRRGDHLHLCELHSEEFKLLTANTQSDNRIRIERTDGLARIKALIPPIQKRAVILIDPSYEIKDDYFKAIAALSNIYLRMPSAHVLLWYPVIHRANIDQMINALRRTNIQDLWQFELGIAADAPGFGLTASGLLAINPPWTLPEQLAASLPQIQMKLSGEYGACKIENLIREK